MSDDNSDLSPCPFCGGGETRIDKTKTRASVLEQYEVMGVYVRHWCGGFARGAQSATIQVRGRNRSDAIAAWNRRAAQEARPMSNDKLDWNDRAALLVEVERLKAFNVNAARETLEAVGKAADDAREEMRAEVEKLRAERDEARAEIERTHALLKDPNAVVINMLRGVIALPSADQMRHIYQQTLEGKP